MGFLESVHERGTWHGPLSLKDPALAALFGGGSRSAAGPIVNELTAFTCAAFYNGVDQISSDTAKLPLNLLKRLKLGGSEPYVDSKTYKLMKFRPNPETGSLMFRKTLVAWALVYGNGYAEIVRDGMGRPSALWLLHPKRVEPFYAERPEGRKPLRYRIDGDLVLEPTDVIHLAGLSDDGVVGYNLVAVAREALGMALASQAFMSAFFGNGTRFGGVLSSDQELDEEQKKEILEAVEKLHAKADRAFRLLVLGAGMKFEQTGVKPNDAQMTELRDQQVTEVARYLNIPLHKLKLAMPGAVSYASVEMADLDYYKGPILTWTKALEEELDAKLISPLEWGHQYFKHNNNAFLRGDIKSRYDALGIARSHGVISANEWRELEDMNPQSGNQGNLYLVQGAMVPQEKLIEIVDANIKKASTPPAPALPPGGGETNSVLRDAVERFDAAVGLLEQARTWLQERRARLEETDAALVLKDDELSRLRAQVETHEVIVAERQREVERLTAAQASDHQRMTEAADHLATVIAERDACVLAVEEARASVAESKTALVSLRTQLTEAKDFAQLAEEEAAQARQRVIDADLLAQAATTDREALRAAGAVLERQADEARELAESAVAEQQRLRAAVDIAQALATEAAQTADGLDDARSAAEARVAALEVELAGTRAEREAALQSASHATARAIDGEVRVAELTERHDATVAAAKAARAKEIARLSQVISAIRLLIADVARRLVERETDRARSRQQTPDKLRTWIETFYGAFEDAFVEAILPAVRVHVAWKGSEDSPRDIALGLAQRYVEESKTQLRAFLGAPADDFAVAVDHLLRRWEKDRPEAIADALLEEEIAHLRELERQS